MDEKLWGDVDRYISEMMVPADAALEAALKASAAADLPSINVSPTQGKFLMLLAQIQGAKDILEIGTLGGYSTIWLGRALPAGGHLVTLEVDPKHARVATENITRAGLSDRVELILGKASESLGKLSAQKRGPFDLIFVDADKSSLPHYFQWSLKLSRPGTVILIDNVIRDGKVIDAKSKDDAIQGVRRMNEMIAKEMRVSATAIQTVGAKGYDGFSLVRVN
jgi:predicted O-methyltransferase YrrM